MTKREKILMALSICLPNTEDDAEKDCRDCPYWVCGDMVSIPVRLIEDMRNLLEAQEPSDDWISRNRLKNEIQYYIDEAGWGEEINKALGWCLEFIDNQEAVKWDD